MLISKKTQELIETLIDKSALQGIQRGIEKESLRSSLDGVLSQTPHPQNLGSALCNPWLTLDFSEALLEFVTPTFHTIEEAHTELEALHGFVHSELHQNELLWPASMPCILPKDSNIPLAFFGNSNSGKMKTIYRRGLGHRYGRAMQTVAGIHYNFSIPVSYWEQEHANAESIWQEKPLQEYINSRYLGLIRNFRRLYWLLIYLFGASPIVDASFVQGREHSLEHAKTGDLYRQHATSLRMGDLGYQSNAQKSLFVCYNSLESYLTTLRHAIRTPYKPYQSIGVKRNDEYQQLSDALLQIENEFYSPIRPKRVTQSGQTPASALTQSGIEYIEVRCMDLNPFAPYGIDQQTMAFLDCFLIGCLFAESEWCDEEDFHQVARNQKLIVNQGRDPKLLLTRRIDGQAEEISVRAWGTEILDVLEFGASILDSLQGTKKHGNSLLMARERINNVEATPSAKILRTLKENHQTHVEMSIDLASQYAKQCLSTADKGTLQSLGREALNSHQKQKEIESTDSVSFEQFLENYKAQ